ncbi:diphthamide biosynthesis protein 3 [Pyronema omphalodes]|nr:diphthamide biosynthesis protein 3 [Pyronema omphalodes]
MADENSIYDQIEIEDMTFDPATQLYTYPCPCGDRFEISLDDLRDGQDIGVCPTCSLLIQVIYEPEDLPETPAPAFESAKVEVTA